MVRKPACDEGEDLELARRETFGARAVGERPADGLLDQPTGDRGGWDGLAFRLPKRGPARVGQTYLRDVRLFLAALVVALASGCGDNGVKPTLEVFSDSDGVLHVIGRGWNGCANVTVNLPKPWTGSKQAVGEDGRFSLMYAHPLVKPYVGAVTATCAESPKRTVATEIRVGDPRSQRS